MEIPTKYDPAMTEDKWYKYWMDKGFFHSEPDEREPYTIVIPPPNVTGVLHMGHMLNNTIQDVLVRRARMLGYNACWVPGTDHASIATEAKVVAKLRNEGIDKATLTREEFLVHAWEWKEKHGGIILEQLKKLGASCDWDRTAFTMDKSLSESVIKVFVDLHKKGLIYRGVRMVNWDPQAKTAVSDEEVLHKEEQSKLYYVRYLVEGSKDEYVTIATTRPETIIGDTAVCINPNDERYRHLHGKRVIVPMVNRTVPIIVDDYVDMEFGTGCLKITPAHDINDYEIGIRHNLDSIDIFNDNGTINESCGIFENIDRFEARELSAKKLEELGNLVKIEDYINKVGYSERTDAVIEPKLSMQWFLKMKKLSEPALQNVMNDVVQLVPSKFKNTYRHWMENVKDWCVSRQLWWGHRIPAYYLPNSNEFVVAETPEEAVKLAQEKTGQTDLKLEDLRQDEDVLDTWFSSWLWPLSVFDGIRKPDNKDVKYYYPTNDLVTAPEILFFWVARMIIAGYEYAGKKPFNNVYLTGIVRDKQRRKMSKSLGNSPDPIDLMKIYGADGVRVGMLLSSPAGNDLLFDESLCEQGRNFANKIWNAFRLVKSWKVDESIPQPQSAKEGVQCFEAILNSTIEALSDNYKKFRLSDALMTVYKLFWDEFSSWYLEIVKPGYQQPIDKTTYNTTISFFEKLLKLLHPFMPFITEEIYHFLAERKDGESIMVSDMPKEKSYEQSTIDWYNEIKEAITALRKVRLDNKIKNIEKKELEIEFNEGYKKLFFQSILEKLGNFEINIDKGSNRNKEGISCGHQSKIARYSIYVEAANKEDERKKLEEELKYTKGFLNSVIKKLSNERFVSGAPEAVVAKEKQKQADAEIKIKALEEQINLLK